MSCMTFRDEQRVVHMLRLGYRSAIIRTTVPSLTRLRLRRIATSIGVKPMDRGPLPTSRRLLRTAKSCLGGSVLMTIYENLHEDAGSTLNMGALEKSLRIYSSIREDHRDFGERIDNNAAWVLARDLRSTDIFWAGCSCGFRYLISIDSLRPDVCPACAIQREEKPHKRQNESNHRASFSGNETRFVAHAMA